MKTALKSIVVISALLVSACGSKGGSAKMRPRGKGAPAGAQAGAKAPVADGCPANAIGKFENETLAVEIKRGADSKLEISIGTKGEEPYVLIADGQKRASSETDHITVKCEDSKIKTDGQVAGVQYTSTYTFTASALAIEQTAPAQKLISLTKSAAAPEADDADDETPLPSTPGTVSLPGPGDDD